MLWLDEYERRARLVPGLLAIFPLAILLTVLSLRQLSVVSYVLSTVVLIGAPVVIADVVRHHGRRAEKDLWATWGGPPTTEWLRLSAPAVNAVQRDLWRKSVAEASGIDLLSRQAERGNPSRADQTIEAAVGRVRDRTRDTQRFNLLFCENRNYGFARNLFGFRIIGRAISLAAVLVVGGYMLCLSFAWNKDAVNAENLFGVSTCAAFFVYWLVWPSATRVREAAERYTHQLLQSASVLNIESIATDPNQQI